MIKDKRLKREYKNFDKTSENGQFLYGDEHKYTHLFSLKPFTVLCFRILAQHSPVEDIFNCVLDRIKEKKKWTKTRLYLLGAGVMLLIIVSYGFLISNKKSSLNVETERLLTSKVWKGNFQEFIPVDGTVLPGETIYLDVIQGGMVEKVFVEDGAKVKKGDTLVKLSNANLELEYINRETQMFDILNNLQSSKAALEKNRLDLQKQLLELNYKIDVSQKKYDTDKKLVDDKYISANEFAETKREYDFLLHQKEIAISAHRLDSAYIATQMETLNSGIARMRTNLNSIHKILDQLYITAPISGQLSSLSANTGELKQAGDKLGQIDVQNFYKVKASVDERYVSRVFVNQPAVVEYNGKNYNLSISQILPEVKDGTFSVNMLFADSIPEGIKRGQNLAVKMKFGGVSKALMIARGAFYQSTGGNWIYVTDAGQHTASKRNIRIGRQNVDAYEVLEGLEEGEQVIISSYKAYNEKDELILDNKKSEQ